MEIAADGTSEHDIQTFRASTAPERQEVESLERYLTRRASEISANNPDFSIQVIVNVLVQSCSENYQLLAGEFTEKFRELGIANILVKSYVERLNKSQSPSNGKEEAVPAAKNRKMTTAERDSLQAYFEGEPVETHDAKMCAAILEYRKLGYGDMDEYLDLLDARKELQKFLANYAGQTGTVNAFIRDKLQPDEEYEPLNYYHLFDAETQKLFIDQIDKAAEKIAGDKFKELSKSKDLILGYIFKKVIRVDQQGLEVDEANLEKLVRFLDSEGYTLEDLYMLLYQKLKENERRDEITQTRRRTRARIRHAADPHVTLSNIAQIDPNFDFHRFFHRYLTQAIEKVRHEKLYNRKTRIEIADVTLQEKLTHCIHPTSAAEPFRSILALQGVPAVFMDEVQRYFNYKCWPDVQFDNNEVNSELGSQLGQVGKAIQYSITAGLALRKEDDSIHDYFQFFPSIIRCKDIGQLLNWMLNPKDFLRSISASGDLPAYYWGKNGEINKRLPWIVSHQAMTMLKLLLRYRDITFSDSYKNAEKHKKALEYHLTGMLGLSGQEKFPLEFRVGEEISPNVKKDGSPDYRIFMPENELLQTYPNRHGDGSAELITYNHRIVNDRPDRTVEITENGKLYRVYPRETKNFKLVNAAIRLPGAPIHRCKYLIYLGRGSEDEGVGSLLDVKSRESTVSADIRQKEVTDTLRWTVVPLNAIDDAAVRKFTLQYYSAIPPQKVIDTRGNRDYMQKRPATIEPSTSKEFKKTRAFTGAMYAIRPQRVKVVNEQGETFVIIDHTKIPFETQVNGIYRALLGHSAYSNVSHGYSYTPAREFGVMAKALIPPPVYGSPIPDFILEGYNGGKNGNGSRDSIPDSGPNSAYGDGPSSTPVSARI